MRFSASLIVAISVLAVGSSACGEQDSFTTQEVNDASGEPAGNDDKKPAGKKGDADANPKKDVDKNPTDGEAPDDELPDDIATKSGAAYFEQKVLPVFQAQCVSCHADPRQEVEIRGPLSIYSYAAMKTKLIVGGSAKANDLINKVTNKIIHDGGDRCNENFEASPCKEISAWYIVEQGDDQSEIPGSGVAGRVFEVTSLGKVIGWAYNPEDTTQELSVNFYIDGVSGVGTKIGPILANRSGADNNTPGNHAFLLDIPMQFRDKKKHTLYAYALIDGREIELSSEPYEFTAYAPSDAGRAYYNANVANAVTGCGGCHALSYEQHFYALVSPSPSEGGTAANNVLINKAGARNATTHGGGNRCVGGNPCNVFQQWWEREFGTPQGR